VKYEWDFNNNGVFELDGGSEPLLSHPLTKSEKGTLNVRVTDSDGLSATASAGFTAYEEWIHSYGGSSFETLSDIAYDNQGAIYFLGDTSSFGSTTIQMLCRLDLSGAVVWARGWEGGQLAAAVALGLMSDGRIVTCGFVRGGSFNQQSLYIQTWSPDGELLTSRFLDNDDQFFPDAMRVRGSAAFIAGGLGAGDNVALMRYGLDDGSIKIFAFSHPVVDFFGVSDLVVRNELNGNSIYVAGDYTVGTTRQALVAEYGYSIVSGNLQLSDAWALGSHTHATSLVVAGTVIPEVVVAGLVDLPDVGPQSFISSIKAGSPIQSVWNTGQHGFIANGIVSRPGGGFCLCSGSGIDAYIHEYSASGANELAMHLFDDSLNFDISNNLENLANVGVLAGGRCVDAESLAFEAAPGAAEALSQTWLPATFEAVAVPSLSSIDLPGIVTPISGLVLDSGGGDHDALLFNRRVPAAP
jgi:hypothetical protein